MEKPKLKGLIHVTNTRGGSDFTMGRVVRLESSSEILGADKAFRYEETLFVQGKNLYLTGLLLVGGK